MTREELVQTGRFLLRQEEHVDASDDAPKRRHFSNFNQRQNDWGNLRKDILAVYPLTEAELPVEAPDDFDQDVGVYVVMLGDGPVYAESLWENGKSGWTTDGWKVGEVNRLDNGRLDVGMAYPYLTNHLGMALALAQERSADYRRREQCSLDPSILLPEDLVDTIAAATP
jgi:hypothetical protein